MPENLMPRPRAYAGKVVTLAGETPRAINTSEFLQSKTYLQSLSDPNVMFFYACALGARVPHSPAETRRGRQRTV